MTLPLLTERTTEMQVLGIRINDTDLSVEERIELIDRIQPLLVPPSHNEGAGIVFDGRVPTETEILAHKILVHTALHGETDELRIAAIQAMADSESMLALNLGLLLYLTQDEQVGTAAETALATLVQSEWRAAGMLFGAAQQLAEATLSVPV